MKFTTTNETTWYSDDDEGAYFIAKTIQGGKYFFDTWRRMPPQCAPLPGAPFRSLDAAQNACRADAASLVGETLST